MGTSGAKGQAASRPEHLGEGGGEAPETAPHASRRTRRFVPTSGGGRPGAGGRQQAPARLLRGRRRGRRGWRAAHIRGRHGLPRVGRVAQGQLHDQGGDRRLQRRAHPHVEDHPWPLASPLVPPLLPRRLLATAAHAALLTCPVHRSAALQQPPPRDWDPEPVTARVPLRFSLLRSLPSASASLPVGVRVSALRPASPPSAAAHTRPAGLA